MNPLKRRRKRGVILTPQGFDKLQTAKSQAQSWENLDKRYTLEDLSDRTGLDPDTLMKVFHCQVGVDKQTLNICFRAFNLLLEPSDYQLPRTDEVINNQDSIQNFIDWGEAPDISGFVGRTAELTTLKHWILEENCRLVTVLGMDGMGKTSLSVKLTEQIQDKFEFVIWRSLRNAPPFKDMLAELIKLLSKGQKTTLSKTLDGRISQLIHYLKKSRCLLILDNLETISQKASAKYNLRYYVRERDGYSELITRVAQTLHQSCLVLTSQETPKEIRPLIGEKLPVRALQVKGLQVIEVEKILKNKGEFCGSSGDFHQLIDSYAGNPLLLNIAANKIHRLFDGNILEFLNQKALVFGEIHQLLKEQFNRFSDIENIIIEWLANNSQPASFSELRSQISPAIPPQKLIDALESLQEQSLVNKNATLFSVAPMIREYVNQQSIQNKISSKYGRRQSQKYRSILTREKIKLSFNVPALTVVKQQG
ncbi:MULTISPECIES: NACHT domain-containing protein [unclassified Nostoc]|uniref:NACHT domain-containing protein n=1 Tax=unclassified Nostoc TaxID=2593658 RepID=UPI002AD380C4|nr:NACHT domain-containing protein [Nostoc sp. DedQUE03]MDZ7977299.1 NACHT domain-containing protein [Nostoc sp. DedQUE03]MDZ8048274.1 NACHT domain-containing protein [Nostoc sp. DedQUE02]